MSGKKDKDLLLIRADADSRIGAGHVMRCLALAQAWMLEGGHAVFLSHCDGDALPRQITDAGIEFIPLADPCPASRDLETTLEFLQTHAESGIEGRKSKIGNPPWLVLDGYHFDADYQQAVRSAGYRLLVIDDTVRLPIYHADILLNQNLGAEKLKYNCDPDTTILLGSRYVLLRREFLAWKDWKREITETAHKVLVTMGGSDPHNITLKVVHALEQAHLDDLDVVVVVGGSNPHYAILQSAMQNLPFKSRLERNATNMPELMAWADVAVSAAGSTSWELLFMGLSSVVLAWADNQRGVAEQLGESGFAINLGWHEYVTPLQVAESLCSILDDYSRVGMADKGRNLVDGLGVKRIIKTIFVHQIVLRRADESDCELLWMWVNDPSVRLSAFHTDLIPLDIHRKWFSTKLTDSHCFQFIATDTCKVPVGQVRFDLVMDEAEIDVSVESMQRGKGYAPFLIKKGIQELEKMTDIHVINAYVKSENTASINSFQMAGFICVGFETINGCPAIHLIWRKDD